MVKLIGKMLLKLWCNKKSDTHLRNLLNYEYAARALDHEMARYSRACYPEDDKNVLYNWHVFNDPSNRDNYL